MQESMSLPYEPASELLHILAVLQIWVGNSVGNTDVVRNSDVWSRDRP